MTELSPNISRFHCHQDPLISLQWISDWEYLKSKVYAFNQQTHLIWKMPSDVRFNRFLLQWYVLQYCPTSAACTVSLCKGDHVKILRNTIKGFAFCCFAVLIGCFHFSLNNSDCLTLGTVLRLFMIFHYRDHIPIKKSMCCHLKLKKNYHCNHNCYSFFSIFLSAYLKKL